MCSTVITLHICKFIFSVTFHVNMGKNCLVVPSYCTELVGQECGSRPWYILYNVAPNIYYRIFPVIKGETENFPDIEGNI